MRGICHRLNGERYEPNRHGVQGAQGRDPVQLCLQQLRGTRTPAERRLGDEELEPLATAEQSQLTIQPCREDLGEMLLRIGRLEHSEYSAGVLGGLQKPWDNRRLEGQDLPSARLQVPDVALDMPLVPESAAPVVDLGVRGIRQRRKQVGRARGRAGCRRPRCYFGHRQQCRARLGPGDFGLADADPLRELPPGKAGKFPRAPKLCPEALPLARLRPDASVWSNHPVIPDPFCELRHDESNFMVFMVIHFESYRCISRAGRRPSRQAKRAHLSVADRATRTLTPVVLWVFTLAAMYVALRRSGVYGLVADAQNLIAIFGALHATAFAIQARQVRKVLRVAGSCPRIRASRPGSTPSWPRLHPGPVGRRRVTRYPGGRTSPIIRRREPRPVRPRPQGTGRVGPQASLTGVVAGHLGDLARVGGPSDNALPDQHCQTVLVKVRLSLVDVVIASEGDTPGFAELAAQVEHWFGPMVDQPGFHTVLAKHIRRGSALVATSPVETGLLGGMLFTAKPPAYHVRWLVVSEHARGKGVGRALMDQAMRRFVTGPGVVEVVTFGADHPGASASGARAFYERLGFTPGEAAAAGPEGGSRQIYRRRSHVSDPQTS